MKRDIIIKTIKDTLLRQGIQKAFLFGSFARKERKYHDIDIAIEPPEDFSLLDLVHVENQLKKKIKKNFDVITINSISPHFKPYIQQDIIEIM
ncbi:MAG: nucleotidyltransferase domain-containing protein [Nitrospirae bacterium]|nr:nucleotidyltransferase domain-containing protein [Nitrospirota bacterium]